KAIPALSHRLHAVGIAHLGIAKTAESLCRELSEQYSVSIAFTYHGISEHLSEAVAICLFRVLQEALQNAIKHSGAPRIQVTLKNNSDEIDLTVHDSGRGFNLEDTSKGPGLGLTSMRERLKLVDGQLSIDSKPGRGTTIDARVPLGQDNRAAAHSVSP